MKSLQAHINNIFGKLSKVERIGAHEIEVGVSRTLSDDIEKNSSTTYKHTRIVYTYICIYVSWMKYQCK